MEEESDCDHQHDELDFGDIHLEMEDSASASGIDEALSPHL